MAWLAWLGLLQLLGETYENGKNNDASWDVQPNDSSYTYMNLKERKWEQSSFARGGAYFEVRREFENADEDEDEIDGWGCEFEALLGMMHCRRY